MRLLLSRVILVNSLLTPAKIDSRKHCDIQMVTLQNEYGSMRLNWTWNCRERLSKKSIHANSPKTQTIDGDSKRFKAVKNYLEKQYWTNNTTGLKLPLRIACVAVSVAGGWKQWAKERTGAREGDTRGVSFSRARFFQANLEKYLTHTQNFHRNPLKITQLRTYGSCFE